ncbi:MAG: ABC transporter substrate-binding protein [Lachnospiraceae bacterium]|nr:ABC transporter substrate-binding protein [Lachnospiraceae bacterium]
MKKVISILVALVTVAALCACSGGGNNPETTGGEGGTNTDRKASNSVVVGISQDIDSLDPHNVTTAGTREVLFNLYEGLVKATSGGDVEPAVASEYTIAEDFKSILFTIREGVKFWDGTEVTADDIIFSVERYAETQGEGSAFSIFESIEKEGENQIRVNLSEPSSEFIYLMTCAIIPASYGDDPQGAPQGTGPFAFDHFSPGEEFVVTKNANYWKENCPYLDRVTFKIVTDTESAILQLNAGTIDIFQYLTADQASTVDANMFNIVVGSINYVQGMFLNNNAAPFNNKLVRQAVYYAVDRQMISDMLFEGTSHIIGTNMIPAASTYYNAATETTYTHDVAKAKELLKEAGYENGFEFTIKVPNNYKPHERTAEVIKENLAEVGITANIKLIDFNEWLDVVYKNRDYEATVVAVDGTLAPSSFFTKNVSDNVNNFTNYNNPEFDELYVKALSETDKDKKIEYYMQLQQILADDAASIYCQDPSNLVAVNSQLEGYVFFPISAQDMSVIKYK